MAAAEAGAGAGSTTTSRFAAACGALSRYVKAAEMARAARPTVVVRTLSLMPGADVDDAAPESREETEPEPAPSQLTIVYGGRVLVLDDVPADEAAGLMTQVAAAAATGGAKRTAEPITAADLPVARKASLQRFMEKRKGRVAARATPYSRPDSDDACSSRLELAL